jgi:hypothetical protein
LIALFALLTGRVDAAARAFLDRSSVTLGETVTLNIELDRMSGVQPDLSPLEQNFRLLGTSSSSQLQMINGQQTARQLWAVALEPLREGVIGIPALDIGGSSTEPLTLTVLPAPQGASGGAGDDVFLEVEAQPLDPYVQQQVRYTVRLHYAVNLAEGQLEEPQVDGARLQRLGSDTRFQKRVADRRYEVVERRYALVPERSGALEISAPRFRGAAVDLRGGGFFNGGRRLQANGDAVTLNVRGKPAAAPEPWLPALSLSLDDESGSLDGPLRVGEPFTLSLRLAARGLAADQLPELELPAIAGAQVYPDLESSQTGESGEWLAGERVRRFAVVPQQAGVLEIPPIQIGWWNTASDRAEQAQIAGRRLTIEGAAAELPGSAQSVSGPNASVARVDADPGALDAFPWKWVSLLFAGLWLATLTQLLRSRAARAAAAPSGVSLNPPDLSRVRAALRHALEIGDLPDLARQLRALAPEGQTIGLDRLATRLEDEDQAAAARALEHALYRGGASTPREALLAQLRAAFRRPLRWRSEPSVSTAATSLPPLYSGDRPG